MIKEHTISYICINRVQFINILHFCFPKLFSFEFARRFLIFDLQILYCRDVYFDDSIDV